MVVVVVVWWCGGAHAGAHRLCCRSALGMSALDINFGRTQMMQRELQSQQDFTVAEIFGALFCRDYLRAHHRL
eukprot:COSAG02_NODE_1378_length_12990_cov_3.643705_4_plen_73_part_00